MENIKKKDKTLGVAALIIAVLLAVFLILALVLPVVIAKTRLEDKLDGYRELTDADIMHIFDPMYRDGDFYGDVTAEISVEDAKTVAKKVLEACDGAKYSSTESNALGNWDVSVILRKESGGLCTVYFAQDEFYVTKDTTQYRFKPSKENTDTYSELVEMLEKLIADSSVSLE